MIALEKIALEKIALERIALERIVLERFTLEKNALEVLPWKQLSWKVLPWKGLLWTIMPLKELAFKQLLLNWDFLKEDLRILGRYWKSSSFTRFQVCKSMCIPIQPRNFRIFAPLRSYQTLPYLSEAFRSTVFQSIRHAHSFSRTIEKQVVKLWTWGISFELYIHFQKIIFHAIMKWYFCSFLDSISY